LSDKLLQILTLLFQMRIKKAMDVGKFEGCKNVDDAMCVASLIKEWFRTLVHTRLLNQLPIASIQQGKSALHTELPEPALSVFLWLVDLMADVCKNEVANRMSPRAMAIVIAPNLYDAALASTPQDIVKEMNGATAIVETALRECIAKRKTNGGGGAVAHALAADRASRKLEAPGAGEEEKTAPATE
jgi:hypothetical protein